MKQRVLSVVLALCLCTSSQTVVYASQSQEDSQEQESESPADPDSEGDDTTVKSDSNGEGETGDSDSEEDDTTVKSDSNGEGETGDLDSGEEDTTVKSDNDGEGETGDSDSGEEDGDESDNDSETITVETDKSDSGDEEITVELEDSSLQADVLMEETTFKLVTRDITNLTPTGVYEAMIALKNQDMYKEGAIWTNDEPYSNYQWKGGPLGGINIVAAGCVAFAFTLSDAAFGELQARMYSGVQYEDIKVGDILQVNGDSHTVIVLKVSDSGVVIAEGNLSGKVHWGRTMSKNEVMNITSHYITRYPEDYVSSDDSEANVSIKKGTLAGLTWDLTKAGTLTISGNGTMQGFDSADEQPWKDERGQIRKVVIEDGVTSVGSCAFQGCGVLSAEIPASVETIDKNAFSDSSIISVEIPSSVRTINGSAFRKCENLSSVTISEGVETIVQNAFYGCTSLKAVTLPASVGEVGAGAFMGCEKMKSVEFVSGNKQVKLGDNVFTQCYVLEKVTLPAKIDRIGEGMFQKCGRLTGIEIPQGAESIGGSAFASCSALTTVIIPDSVATIGIAAFANSGLKDVYFTGSETQWSGISKIGDTETRLSKASIHYDYTPTGSIPDTDDNGDSNEDDANNGSSENSNNNSNENSSKHSDSTSDTTETASVESADADSETGAAVETWKPTTPDEIKRYAYVGRETIRYTPSADNAYRLVMENSVQGPMCFQSFEAVLGDYTIGRTYNIYALSDTIYSTDQEVQFTMEIPSSIYEKDREYKMICVTENGEPFLYDDMDDNPETITIQTDKFYAYALIYK